MLSVENPWSLQLVSGILHVKVLENFVSFWSGSPVFVRFTVLKSKFRPPYIFARQARQIDHFFLHQAILENHCYRFQILVSIAPSYCSPWQWMLVYSVPWKSPKNDSVTFNGPFFSERHNKNANVWCYFSVLLFDEPKNLCTTRTTTVLGPQLFLKIDVLERPRHFSGPGKPRPAEARTRLVRTIGSGAYLFIIWIRWRFIHLSNLSNVVLFEIIILVNSE